MSTVDAKKSGRRQRNRAQWQRIIRRRTQMRVLYFAGDGFCLWSKRLERGQFQVSWVGDKQALDYTAWKMTRCPW